jgi:hypothetical protein
LARLALGAVLLALVALPAGAQDEENMMGMAPPKTAETAAPSSSTTTAAVASSAIELPALTRDLDTLLTETWKKANVTPAPDATPGELVRRVYLDLAGRTPTVEEAKEYTDSPEPQKLVQLVDKILASREFAEHLADSLAVVLLGREVFIDPIFTRKAFRDWLAGKIEKDVPFDEIAREILAPKTDSVNKDPAAQYVLLFGGDPAVMAGRTARIFLGNRIACAQCHDHPYEPWKRTDFWSLAAYYSRVRRDAIYEPLTDEMKKKKVQQRIVDWKVWEADAGDTYIPLQNGETGRPSLALPRFLGGTYDLTLHGTKEPRLPSLAKAVTVEKRHELARAFANRFFALLYGRGIVHPVDDFSEGRTGSIPGGLERITKGFEDGGLRVKGYFRALVLTESYARSSAGAPAPSDANVDLTKADQPKADARDKEAWAKRGGAPAAAVADDPALEVFARMRHKPLSPEQALRAFVAASRTDSAAKEQGDAAVKQWEKQEPNILGEFVRLMARHDEEDPHSVQEGIPQALVLMNGSSVSFFCQARPGTTVARAAKLTDLHARIDELYLSAFARSPSAGELKDALAFFEKAKDPNKATEDYFWSLVNSSEFLYNH